MRKPLIDEQLKAYDKDGNVYAYREPLTPPPTQAKPEPDPPATDTAATDPPATDPPATDPPATDPPATDPPATDTAAGNTGGAAGAGAKASGVGPLQDAASVYGNMAKENQELYEQEKAAVDRYAEEQKKLQQEATDLTLQQMEQSKAEAAEDYAKEQSAAYVDYKKQTAKHGVQAEQMASLGMSGTGYSESAKVSMYNAYQNRVAVARQTYTKLVADYNNAMAEAKLQNSSALAEIAFNALQSGLQMNRQNLETQQNLTLQRMNALDQQNTQRAEILAAAGDFSGYKALYGLTDAQVEALKASYTQDAKYEPLTGEELDYWDKVFAAAKTEEALLAVNEMMISNGLNPDVADAFLAMYLNKIQSGGLNSGSAWHNNLFVGNKGSATVTGDGEAPIVK